MALDRMTSMQGLPPMPENLRTLLYAGGTNYKLKEMAKMHQMKASIRQDYPGGSNHIIPYCAENETGCATSTPNGTNGQRFCRNSKQFVKLTTKNVQSALAHLQQEMIQLRQLDASLLCQLLCLGESIQEAKGLVRDRTSDGGVSDCSAYSLDHERIDETDEPDEPEYVNTPSGADRYVNQFFHRSVNDTRTNDDDDDDDDIYEPVYLQPVPSEPPPLPPLATPSGGKQANTTYESSC